MFGRYLANVWYEDGEYCLNDELRNAGLLKENSKWNEG
ncbi:endonuclease [Staphylococcus phage S-CoN_Ph26]|nr:endonuclease [Staphylococcus phage S-CoN_Ph26]